MKKAFFVSCLFVCIVFFAVSCSTFDSSAHDYLNMIPQRYVGWDDLSSEQYDFIGNVVGKASCVIEEMKDGLEEYNNYTGVLSLESYEGITNLEVLAAVNQAVYSMTEKAYALGANFFILPNYSITIHSDANTYTIDVTVTAVAVKLIDRNGNDLKTY